MNFLLALGTINEDLVDCVNADIQETVERDAGGKASYQAGQGFILAPAASGGRGVQHQASDAKRLREAAKLQDKLLAKQKGGTETGRARMTPEEFRRAQQAADRAWQVACEASDTTGFAGFDRDGHRVHAAQECPRS